MAMEQDRRLGALGQRQERGAQIGAVVGQILTGLDDGLAERRQAGQQHTVARSLPPGIEPWQGAGGQGLEQQGDAAAAALAEAWAEPEFEQLRPRPGCRLKQALSLGHGLELEMAAADGAGDAV